MLYLELCSPLFSHIHTVSAELGAGVIFLGLLRLLSIKAKIKTKEMEKTDNANTHSRLCFFKSFLLSIFFFVFVCFLSLPSNYKLQTVYKAGLHAGSFTSHVLLVTFGFKCHKTAECLQMLYHMTAHLGKVTTHSQLAPPTCKAAECSSKYI